MSVTIFLLNALLSLICDRPIYSLCRFLLSSAIACCVLLYFSVCLSVSCLYMDLCCLIQIKCMYVCLRVFLFFSQPTFSGVFETTFSKQNTMQLNGCWSPTVV